MRWPQRYKPSRRKFWTAKNGVKSHVLPILSIRGMGKDRPKPKSMTLGSPRNKMNGKQLTD